MGKWKEQESICTAPLAPAPTPGLASCLCVTGVASAGRGQLHCLCCNRGQDGEVHPHQHLVVLQVVAAVQWKEPPGGPRIGGLGREVAGPRVRQAISRTQMPRNESDRSTGCRTVSPQAEKAGSCGTQAKTWPSQLFCSAGSDSCWFRPRGIAARCWHALSRTSLTTTSSLRETKRLRSTWRCAPSTWLCSGRWTPSTTA